MNKLMITLLMAVMSLSVNAQSINKFFDDLEDRDDVAIVTVNKEMFKMIAAMDEDFKEEGLEELIKSINHLKIYVDEEGASYEEFKQIRTMARDKSMAELLSVKDGAERIYLYTDKSDGEHYVKNLLFMMHDGDQNVFIRLDGRVNLRTVSKLTDKMGIDGLEHLKKIDDKK